MKILSFIFLLLVSLFCLAQLNDETYTPNWKNLMNDSENLTVHDLDVNSISLTDRPGVFVFVHRARYLRPKMLGSSKVTRAIIMSLGNCNTLQTVMLHDAIFDEDKLIGRDLISANDEPDTPDEDTVHGIILYKVCAKKPATGPSV